MDWMNCIEKRLDGLCEIRPIDAVLEVAEGDIPMNSGKSLEEFQAVIMGTKKQLELHGNGELWENGTFSDKSGFFLPGITKCGNPKGYYDTDMGRKSVNCLHAMGHIKLGKEMMDTGTSANDAGPFTGLHANAVRSHLQWRMNAEDFPEVKDEYYHYPSSQDRAVWGKHVGKVPYGTSGPYGTYSMVSSSFILTYFALQVPLLKLAFNILDCLSRAIALRQRYIIVTWTLREMETTLRQTEPTALTATLITL